ncbi:hypothetical protein [Streptococcus mutans]|uniref:hypothetical protein n=1 Tax=Streptococcus mutans TaxID=1309 RepID=UPI0002B54D75|nr:hypothetical protein [Streptococcus mutans]ARS61691.1 hypothetical protein RO10_00140 [Streptococcus mutans]EMB76053.1 hypothetical protein SMU41_04941 [Streptococcus mutans 2VS1]EMB84097.1 hypothetical protein SMU54_07887 [Streptococcus mutans A9]EMC53097.1 hypothetical protein SMU105_08873 [Streptococcus mutans SF12]ESS18355.1 hypothetical protein PLG01_00193 [Streptococcus mutans PKUSS-LG01]
MEEKVFNRKFIYLILGIVGAVFLVIYLIVINVNGSSESSGFGLGSSLNGTYYVYKCNNNVVITDNILKIDGKTALYQDAYTVKYESSDEGKLWNVDTKKQTITKPDEGEYPYTLKKGVLTFGYYHDQYVKKSSKEYKKADKMTEDEFENN